MTSFTLSFLDERASRMKSDPSPSYVLPTGSDEREVLGVGCIPVAILSLSFVCL